MAQETAQEKKNREELEKKQRDANADATKKRDYKKENEKRKTKKSGSGLSYVFILPTIRIMIASTDPAMQTQGERMLLQMAHDADGTEMPEAEAVAGTLLS